MSELDAILATLRNTKHEALDNGNGTYTHIFTPPGITMEDVSELLAHPEPRRQWTLEEIERILAPYKRREV